jgi:ribosomal protein L11 methyltransferase
MYLWRKVAGPRWLSACEAKLQERARGGLAVIAKPDRRRLQLEIACKSQRHARHFLRDFGGRLEKLPPNWWKRLGGEHKTKPLKIGKRLLILRSPPPNQSAGEKLKTLIIPASAAFGTGEHPTTAMSLRLLEQITREMKSGWSIVDLGTGSGILALAAKCLGAKRVIAIDVDPIAIRTAKENARLNQIEKVNFQLGDLRRWKPVRKIDIIIANLLSDLLVEILPKLKRSSWLILSGVLCAQGKELLRVLRRSKIDIVQVRRRGKWIAILARNVAALSQRRTRKRDGQRRPLQRIKHLT